MVGAANGAAPSLLTACSRQWLAQYIPVQVASARSRTSSVVVVVCFCRSLFQVDSMGFQFAQVLTYLALGDIDSGLYGCGMELVSAYRIRSP